MQKMSKEIIFRFNFFGNFLRGIGLYFVNDYNKEYNIDRKSTLYPLLFPYLYCGYNSPEIMFRLFKRKNDFPILDK